MYTHTLLSGFVNSNNNNKTVDYVSHWFAVAMKDLVLVWQIIEH